MRAILLAILLLPSASFAQTFWTNIQTVAVPQNPVDTFILGVTNGPPTNELITASSMLSWTGLGPTNFTLAVSNLLAGVSNYVGGVSNYVVGTSNYTTSVSNLVINVSNVLVELNLPYVFTNSDSGANLTASGTFSTNLLRFTTPSGNTNLWELTVASPWVNVNSSYSVTAQVIVTPDGTPSGSPWTLTLWTDAADSTFPTQNPIIARLAPNTLVTFQITGSGAGSINMRGRTTTTAWIIDPQ